LYDFSDLDCATVNSVVNTGAFAQSTQAVMPVALFPKKSEPTAMADLQVSQCISFGPGTLYDFSDFDCTTVNVTEVIGAFAQPSQAVTPVILFPKKTDPTGKLRLHVSQAIVFGPGTLYDFRDLICAVEINGCCGTLAHATQAVIPVALFPKKSLPTAIEHLQESHARFFGPGHL
jgi:hypothetical protein